MPNGGLLKVSSFSFFVPLSMAVVFGLVLNCCSLGLCHPATIAVLFTALQNYSITHTSHSAVSVSRVHLNWSSGLRW